MYLQTEGANSLQNVDLEQFCQIFFFSSNVISKSNMDDWEMFTYEITRNVKMANQEVRMRND